jgi:hypothetical protein
MISGTLKIIALTCLTLCLGAIVNAQKTQPAKKEKTVTKIAKGTFEVKMTPMTADKDAGDPAIGRLALDKTFSGDLAGSSKGQMLGSQSPVEGSAGYVAMEKFTGTLSGKKGTFQLQHSGTMQGGKFDLNVIVVPDSGTEELKNIAGKMKIIIEGKTHMYELEYTISSK